MTAAVCSAGQRAGVGQVFTHRLRHSAATGMLAAGAPLSEIGQVLRHQRLLSTAIYAKPDIGALRAPVLKQLLRRDAALELPPSAAWFTGGAPSPRRSKASARRAIGGC